MAHHTTLRRFLIWNIYTIEILYNNHLKRITNTENVEIVVITVVQKKIKKKPFFIILFGMIKVTKEVVNK